MCYILDEPTIGLHARDNAMLLDTLRALRKKGNTVVVVEHDEETIRSAEHIIDLGPGAGVNGGRVVAHGSLKRILACPDSLTGRYLASPLAHPLPGVRSPERMRGGNAGAGTGASRSHGAESPTSEERGRSMQGSRARELEHRRSIRGAGLNNLRDLDVDLPLERLVCVTGVSGSGKSSLVRGVLLANLAAALRSRGRGGRRRWTGCREFRGFEAVGRVLEVDQTPIGSEVDAGNTVVVIEHNLDIIAEANTVIDLGPEGGAGGGRVVAAGTPEEIAGARGSHTGEALRGFSVGAGTPNQEGAQTNE